MPLLSMTGYGEARVTEGPTDVQAELRAINNRYLKVSLRISDGYAGLEPRVEEMIRNQIRRGTIQVQLRIQRTKSPEEYRLNVPVLQAYYRQLCDIHLQVADSGPVSIDQLLDLPGVVDEHANNVDDVELCWPLVERALQQSLQHLCSMRAREGQAMAHDLHSNGELIARELDRIADRAPHVAGAYRDRLTDRVNQMMAGLGVHVEPADLIREVSLFSERADISEEIVRLRSHLRQFRTVMGDAESNGRKLDFIVQEMFREINTIGSKANDVQISEHVVEIKSATERLREMIQNVE